MTTTLTALTTQQAADLAGVSRETITRAAKDGRLSRQQQFGVWVYQRSEIEAFAQTRPQIVDEPFADDAALTPKQALVLYNEITGLAITYPGTIVAGMERRGFAVQRDAHGRITMNESDVRAYIEDKLARPSLGKAGKSITIKPRAVSSGKPQRSTIDAVRAIAQAQGYRPIQRQGYVELVRGPHFKEVEPEFLDIDFVPSGVQAQ